MEIVAEDSFLAGVRRKAALFRQRLEGLVAAHPKVFETVRGHGLMLGLRCRVPPAEVVKAGYAQRLLTVPAADNVVRLLPPLIISDDEIAEAVARLDAAAAGARRLTSSCRKYSRGELPGPARARGAESPSILNAGRPCRISSTSTPPTPATSGR